MALTTPPADRPNSASKLLVSHTKLLQSIRIGKQVAPNCRRSGHSAVKIEGCVVRRNTINTELSTCPRPCCDVRSIVRHSRENLNKVVSIPAVQGKILDAFLVDSVTDLRFSRIDKGRRGLNRHVLLRRATRNAKFNVDILVWRRDECPSVFAIEARSSAR